MTKHANSISEAVLPWLLRKLTAAAFATVIVVVYLSVSPGFRGSYDSWAESLTASLGSASIFLLYVTPINFVYGVAASMLVEMALFQLLPKKKRLSPSYCGAVSFFPQKSKQSIVKTYTFLDLCKWLHAPLSLLLHAFCGFWALPMLFGSLNAGLIGAACAAVFFFVDFALSKVKSTITPSHAVLAFVFFPLLLFFIAVISINL